MNKLIKAKEHTYETVSNNNTINVYGDVKGNVTGQINGEGSANFVEENSKNKVLNEIKEAKKIISSLSDINKDQKQLLFNFMDETRDAVESGSKEKMLNSKNNFNNAVCLLGNIGTKLITALSGLVNLLNFFGFSPFKP